MQDLFGTVKKGLYCSTSTPNAALPQYTRRRITRDTLLSLVYCGSCTAAKATINIAAAVHELNYILARVLPLVYCSSRSRAGCGAPACRGR